MPVIDRMPAAWRELVHEYGFVIVDAMRDSMGDANIESARVALRNRHENRQEELLARDWITPEIAEKIKAGIKARPSRRPR